MPGVPKSRGCQTCKQRRIKCDETWPTCAQCKHMNVKCPGLTSLIKFIVHKTSDVSSGKKGSAQTSHSGSALHLRKIQYAKVDDESAGYGLLQATPRSNPTTIADRVGSRLVGNMERGRIGVAGIYMTYLPELPKRLARSPCLRDSTDLFCSAWSSFRRHDPQQGGLMGMPQYGKALRSLGRALLNDQHRDVETLAAMVLLERTSRLFNRDPHQTGIHLKAIREVFRQRGPPNIKDELDVAATNEVHGLLLRDDSGNEENAFLYQSPWKEALSYCADNMAPLNDVRPYLIDDVWVLYGCSKQLYALLPEFQHACRYSSATESAAQALHIRNQLQGLREALKDKPLKLWEKALEAGVITKTIDDESITGHKYSFGSVFLATMYQKILLVRLAIMRMIGSLVDRWGAPDITLLAEFKDVSVYVWKMIPYVRSLESVIAIDMVRPMLFSYEAANSEEKEYLLNSILEIDENIGRYPRDKTALEATLKNADQILSYFVDESI
ncbi:unnamed protein product [Clonostachys byssicola]|uniref:Zn(2)-C6 fungal-type domain-containing protein n=1 Tax=Clonostachys byssicola TaxID=160290 RepID=A0A9N9UAA5_9HYPO|nr:unnamed protein product [Clonostachys byssicola]